MAAAESGARGERDRYDRPRHLVVGRPHFDYEAAAPILVRWLPRLRDPIEKEVIARSLAGVKRAPPEAARVLIDEFRRDESETWTQKWAYANTLATIAGPDVADDLIELLHDRCHGRGREKLCDALKRTKDPRTPDVPIELIDDDDVARHAISALRSYGPHLRRARPKLEAVVKRPMARPMAKKRAQKALERLADAS